MSPAPYIRPVPLPTDESPAARARRAQAEAADLAQAAVNVALGQVKNAIAELTDAAGLLDGQPALRDRLRRFAGFLRSETDSIEAQRARTS